MEVGSRTFTVVFISAFSGLILNVDQASVILTLGRIGEEFGSGISGSQWVLSAYLLPLASCVIAGGTIADRYPVLRVFIFGLLAFIVGSVLSFLAQSLGLLVVARIICGFGAGAVFPASLALIQKGLPADSSQRAFGIWFGAAIGGSALGPLGNGYLLDNSSWRIVFIMSAGLSMGLVIIVLISRLSIPLTSPPARTSILSTVVMAGSLLAIVFGLIRAGTFGWTAQETLLPLIAGLGIAFIRVCFKFYQSNESLIIRSEIGGAIPFIGIMLVSIIPVVGVVVILILYLGVIRDLTSFETGLAILPFGLTAAVVAPIVPRLIGRYGFAKLLLFAIVMEFIGMVSLTQITPRSSYFLIGVALFCFGVSMAVFPPLTLSRASEYVPPRQSGYLSGVHNAAIQVGQLLSIALIGSIANSKISDSLRNIFSSEPRWGDISEDGYIAMGAGEEWYPPQISDLETEEFGELSDLGFTTGFANTVTTVLIIGIVFAIVGGLLSRRIDRYFGEHLKTPVL